jgi:hypothetical protein
MLYLITNICNSKLFIFLVFLLILIPGTYVSAADVILLWDRPDDSRVTGYKIFYGLADRDFKSTPKEIIHSAEETSCDIYNLKEGRTYGFAAKSIDGKGNESDFSEVLYYDVPETQDDDPDNPDDKPDDPDDKPDEDEDSSGGGGGGCFIKSLMKNHRLFPL